MIPVYKPWLTSKEKKYVNDALDSGWISSTGKYVEKAEELFADYIGVKHAITTTSGTTALHLCLRATGIEKNGKDGYIIVPNITFIATAFAASYEDKKILIADVDHETWNLDPAQVEHYCATYNVSAVIPVHLYGNPADMTALKELQKAWNFVLIEDACESLGSTIDGKMTGSIGDLSCFSFYGNKSLSVGEGGMVTTNNDAYAKRAKLLRGQAQDPNKRYWHIDIGHNYRMTNIQAAILCAQIERSDEIMAEKSRVANRYSKNLKNVEEITFQKVLKPHHNAQWLISFLTTAENKDLSAWMGKNDVDTRKVFYPLSDMPPYKDAPYSDVASQRLSKYGVSYPSYPELSNQEIDHICDLTKQFFKTARTQ